MKELAYNVSSFVHLVRVHPLPVYTIIYVLHNDQTPSEGKNT